MDSVTKTLKIEIVKQKSNASMITKNTSHFHCSSTIQGEKVARKKSLARWSKREKKILSSVLKNVGHINIENLMKALPLKNRYQISRYLNRAKRKASTKLRKKYSKVQNTLQRIHQWISLLNLNGTDLVIHKNLAAFILPLVIKYGTFSSKSQADFKLVNFKLAYRFIFESLCNSMQNQANINDEIKALLFSGFNQITDEIRRENSEVNEIFNSTIVRLIHQTNKPKSVEPTKIIYGRDIFSMFEINPFLWTNEEIEILCQKKL